MTIELFIILFLIAFSLIAYITLDGNNLGVGMMLPFQGKISRQFVLQNLVATVWDASESWIILFGTLLWGALPGAYSELLPQCYFLFIIIILSFVFRTMAIEFSVTHKKFAQFWRYVFISSSWTNTVAQGWIVATLLSNFLNPNNVNILLFQFLVTIGVVLLYIINGMNWQRLKSVGKVRRNAIKYGKSAIILFVIVLLSVGFILVKPENLLLKIDPTIYNLLFVISLIVLMVQAANYYLYFVKTDKSQQLSMILSRVSNLLLISMALLFIYPNITPDLSIQEAVNPSSSSVWFLIIGVCLCMPMVLWYNTFAHKIFKGKQKYILKD